MEDSPEYVLRISQGLLAGCQFCEVCILRGEIVEIEVPWSFGCAADLEFRKHLASAGMCSDPVSASWSSDFLSPREATQICERIANSCVRDAAHDRQSPTDSGILEALQLVGLSPHTLVADLRRREQILLAIALGLRHEKLLIIEAMGLDPVGVALMDQLLFQLLHNRNAVLHIINRDFTPLKWLAHASRRYRVHTA